MTCLLIRSNSAQLGKNSRLSFVDWPCPDRVLVWSARLLFFSFHSCLPREGLKSVESVGLFFGFADRRRRGGGENLRNSCGLENNVLSLFYWQAKQSNTWRKLVFSTQRRRASGISGSIFFCFVIILLIRCLGLDTDGWECRKQTVCDAWDRVGTKHAISPLSGIVGSWTGIEEWTYHNVFGVRKNCLFDTSHRKGIIAISKFLRLSCKLSQMQKKKKRKKKKKSLLGVFLDSVLCKIQFFVSAHRSDIPLVKAKSHLCNPYSMRYPHWIFPQTFLSPLVTHTSHLWHWNLICAMWLPLAQRT